MCTNIELCQQGIFKILHLECLRPKFVILTSYLKTYLGGKGGGTEVEVGGNGVVEFDRKLLPEVLLLL